MAGIVLAAGQSARMRAAKALLPVGSGGPTFVAALIDTLRRGGVADVLVVGRSTDAALRQEAETRGARFVVNPHPEGGQLSSLLAGLAAAEHTGVEAVLVTPVDAPGIGAATVATLLERFHAASPAIARAVHGGRHGHPVIFSRRVFDALRRADPAVGARDVVRSHHRDVLDVDVPDAGVLQDIDTPADYERMLRGTDPA